MRRSAHKGHEADWTRSTRRRDRNKIQVLARSGLVERAISNRVIVEAKSSLIPWSGRTFVLDNAKVLTLYTKRVMMKGGDSKPYDRKAPK